MPNAQSMKDITGQTFGSLTALYPTKKRAGNGCVIWHCECACGETVDVSGNELRSGSVIDCGRCTKQKRAYISTSVVRMILSDWDNVVVLNQQTKKWEAIINRGSRHRVLGSFETKVQAADALNYAETVLCVLFAGKQVIYYA